MHVLEGAAGERTTAEHSIELLFNGVVPEARGRKKSDPNRQDIEDTIDRIEGFDSGDNSTSRNCSFCDEAGLVSFFYVVVTS